MKYCIDMKNIPFEFVLDYLYPLNPEVKQFFGCFGIYIGKKIVFILRNRKDHADDNGVWLATDKEQHKSLKKEFSSLRSIALLGGPETEWQLIPASSDDFESAVIKACELVLKGDKRIGRIPKPRAKKKQKI